MINLFNKAVSSDEQIEELLSYLRQELPVVSTVAINKEGRLFPEMLKSCGFPKTFPLKNCVCSKESIRGAAGSFIQPPIFCTLYSVATGDIGSVRHLTGLPGGGYLLPDQTCGKGVF